MEQWTIREQLILGSAVQRSGDQNWVSVSRTIRPLSEENRQPDFYSQKNCAMHYAALLDSASTPKRKKKRGSESETGETTQDLIVRELTEKRLAEINQLLDGISSEYHEVKKNLELIEKGQLSDDELANMWSKVKDVDYNEVTISQCVSQKDDIREENDKQEQQQLTSAASDKGQLEVDRPVLSLANKLVTTQDGLKVNRPLIATPIITPVGTSATLIKIEPNVAMETIGGAKPVQVKVLSHDDHTYSSPGPATLLNVNTPESQATSQVDDESGKTVIDQTSPTPDQVDDDDDDNIPRDETAPSNSETISSAVPDIDQANSSVDQLTPSIGQPTPRVDQPTPSIDQPTPSVGQPIPNVDQPTPNVDRPTPNIGQPTPSIDQPTSSIDQATPGVDQLTANVYQSTSDVDTTVDKSVTDSDTITVDELKVDQATPTNDQSTNQPTSSADQNATMDQASDIKATKHVDQGSLPLDDQSDSSASQIPLVSDEATNHTTDQTPPKVDQSKADQTSSDQSSVVITDSVNKDAIPTTTDQATLNVDQIPTPTVADPDTNQSVPVSDQTVSTIEKKSRTRGSNRIAGKMKMAQVGKAKAVKATSPRTMVIIGKQQTTVESDNEEIQVHYKEPTRRIYRLMSNEPSESEEEPLSAVTSGMTSPSSSMIDEIDPEVAQSMKLWRKSIMLVWQHASQHKFASLFLHAVKDEEATGYSEVVFRPMDLSLIKKKIETGVIRNDMEFQRDILLMFQNAIMYNSSNHDVYMMANEMRKDVMENIQDYLATQLMVHSNARTKILRSRDSRKVEQDEEPTPLRKTRHRLPSDESTTSTGGGAPLAKRIRTRTNDD